MLDDALTVAGRELKLAPGARVLDYGCGDGHYRKLVPEGAQYFGIDLPGNPDAEAALNADGTLPYADSSFDAVLSIQVLEHVDSPTRYLDECRRVLKPGGTLLISTHGIMVYHRDPVDYWRWTHEGLLHLLSNRGFEVTGSAGVLGLAAVGLQLFQDATYWRLPAFLRRPYVAIMQGLVAWFDRRYSAAGRLNNALVYVVTAHPAQGVAT